MTGLLGAQDYHDKCGLADLLLSLLVTTGCCFVQGHHGKRGPADLLLSPPDNGEGSAGDT